MAGSGSNQSKKNCIIDSWLYLTAQLVYLKKDADLVEWELIWSNSCLAVLISPHQFAVTGRSLVK